MGKSYISHRTAYADRLPTGKATGRCSLRKVAVVVAPHLNLCNPCMKDDISDIDVSFWHRIPMQRVSSLARHWRMLARTILRTLVAMMAQQWTGIPLHNHVHQNKELRSASPSHLICSFCRPPTIRSSAYLPIIATPARRQTSWSHMHSERSDRVATTWQCRPFEIAARSR
ncbi:uncharacterized protein M421DRAFT_347597 [Didymella exigua CBS 183.55]|uniref:Uncharacterized protein n=1 Tax=Didymella exigua CBS 183.55 TaxID=1150837 RepID=A0A6A5RUD0_9PLEO|nr:uncharacterized protein M421DRAFT_347597 [Didymella exigua CBS 183.55]KAF1931452.1 hypothetical protein M421DRAFT_347597 [Didymella exigua CBS 183.55]